MKNYFKTVMLISLMLGFALASCISQASETSEAATVEPTAAPSLFPTIDPSDEPTPEAPGGSDMVRGPVYLDEAELTVKQSDPPQLVIHLLGNLPTPCHQLNYQISNADDGIIRVDAWSEAPSDQECIQVLQAMDETIELEVAGQGSYKVFLNGEEVGSIDL